MSVSFKNRYNLLPLSLLLVRTLLGHRMWRHFVFISTQTLCSAPHTHTSIGPLSLMISNLLK